MAPRKRQRKALKGQMRKDAAIDAMRSYGFPHKLINTTINELLDVYGLEGWPFIEETSYKVLLDNILEKIEKEAMEKRDCKDGNETKSLAAGTSNSGSVPTCPTEENANEAPDTASGTNGIPNIALQIIGSETNAEGEGSSWKDINLDQDSKKQQMADAVKTEYRDFEAVEKLGSRSHSPKYDVLSPDRVDAFPGGRRRPYYGWISNDDDWDLVELKPAPLPEKIAKLLLVADGSRSLKRRWPEDV
ncbi:hypothetical protein JCGZ_01302 [Jatropha curcas]|uniref:WIYLD domain-containing protein n=1 Tax=Jatropha curcas TaxID=180498 RepID=A0A067L8T6_JATCU|nr:uncharacterized protein LOC105649070 [Jatropha curcas]KDP44802.1 hypothetical protein JCGZ_01302 [Jatropha curcas]